MRVKMEETPLELRRRVANKLDSIRGTPMAAGGDAACLGEFACPVYRPDVQGIAYWEFEIAGLKQTSPLAHTGPSSNLGFMVASTGTHDFPVPHWSLNNQPPSRALEAMAGTAGKVERITKLDTLAYVAEDGTGKYLAHIGQFPLQIAAHPGDLSSLRGINTSIAKPKAPSKDDSAPPPLVLQGAKVPDLKLAAWTTWPAAKEGYAAAYKVHLDALRARAATAWQVEELISRFGEGIHEGDQMRVSLLKPGKAAVAGEGAGHVKMSIVDRQPPIVSLEAVPVDVKKEASFELVISYADGTSEKLQYFVVPKGTPSNYRSTLPHLTLKPEGGVGI